MKSTEPAAQPVVREDLVRLLREAERPESEFAIGAESEKFGVHRRSLRSLGYGEAFGVCKVLGHLREHHAWSPLREFEGGPVLGLERGGASVTLEPAAQLELSGAPLANLHLVAAEQRQHFREIAEVSREHEIAWLKTGFHPWARLDELSWVPKTRYPIMRKYLPLMGSRGLDMMQRTTTVQGNFDRLSEADGMRKLRVGLKLSPIVHALFANSPFYEGKPAYGLSERGAVWLHMDPARSGLLPELWDKEDASYEDYIEWTLDAGMFLIWRRGEILANTGQSFRQFLAEGYQGERATLADYKLHLSTLFPEVRLKSTLEVRSGDSLSPPLALALLAFWTGIFYDARALEQAEELLAPLRAHRVLALRPELVRRGLHLPARLHPAYDNWELAERLTQLACDGLGRRARLNECGQTEQVYLLPLKQLLFLRETPAEQLLNQVLDGSREELLRLCSMSEEEMWQGTCAEGHRSVPEPVPSRSPCSAGPLERDA